MLQDFRPHHSRPSWLPTSLVYCYQQMGSRATHVVPAARRAKRPLGLRLGQTLTGHPQSLSAEGQP